MPLLRACLTYLVFFAALPVLLLHRKLRRGYRQRLGFYRRDEIPDGAPRILMHGASAGDVLALMPTVRALRRRRGDVQIILSTTTNSGCAMATRYREELASVIYQPYDTPDAVSRALQRLEPSLLVLEYTELWPQLIQRAHARGVRIALHNGRFSRTRLERYRWLFWLVGPVLPCIDIFLLRDEDAAWQARALGVAERDIEITGNTKFDNLLPQRDPHRLRQLSQAVAFPSDTQVWVAGSTHEGEDELVLRCLSTLVRDFPRLRLLLAPRYLERTSGIEQRARRLGLDVRRRTSDECSQARVVILDTIGELATAYGLADVVFVGGSFTSRGGQNILEPAAYGKPVIFGPNMENFADSVTLLLGRGGIQVTGEEQLVQVLKSLLERDDYRLELGALAQQSIQSASGAAERNADHLLGLLPGGRSSQW